MTAGRLPVHVVDHQLEADRLHVGGHATAYGLRDDLGGHDGQRLGRSVTRGTYH